MGPSNHPKEIVQNNYDGGSVVNNPQMRAKVGYVVEVELDREAVEKVSDQRDVYLYRGNLDLNKHRHSIYRNPNTQKKELSTWRSEEGTTVDYYFNKRQEFMSTKVHIDEIMKKELSTWRSEEGTTVDYYFNKRQEFMSTKVHIDEIMKPNYTFDYMAYRRFHDPDFTIWDHLIEFFAPLLILGILYVFLKLREMKKSFQLRLSERCGE